jgi:hypothetical protein
MEELDDINTGGNSRSHNRLPTTGLLHRLCILQSGHSARPVLVIF